MESNSGDDDLAECSFGALGTPSTFVNPIFNRMNLSRLDLRTDLSNICNFRFPVRAALDFVHEATHHWCFHSPVGLALAKLVFDADRSFSLFEAEHPLIADARGMWRVPPAATLETRQAAQRFLRHQWALRFLGPLLEGIALYAEFDACPRSDVVWSPPLEWIATLSAARDQATGFADGRFGPFLRDLLSSLRLADDCIDRKVRLLSAPHELATRYAIGYSVVKKWASRLMADGARDSDEALTLLRNYVFCDYDLAEALSTDTNDHFGGAGNFFRLLGESLGQTPDSSFASRCLSREHFAGHRSGAVTSTPRWVDDLVRDIDSRVHALHVGTGTRSNEDLCDTVNAYLLRSRDVMTLATTEVVVESSAAEATAVIAGCPVWSHPAGLTPGTSMPGRLEVHFAPYRGELVVSLSAAERIIASQGHWAGTATAADLTLLPYDMIARYNNDVTNRCWLFSQASGDPAEHGRAVAELCANMGHMYHAASPWSLLLDDERFRATGFLALMDRERLRVVARHSLEASLGVTVSAAPALLESIACELNEHSHTLAIDLSRGRSLL